MSVILAWAGDPAGSDDHLYAHGTLAGPVNFFNVQTALPSPITGTVIKMITLQTDATASEFDLVKTIGVGTVLWTHTTSGAGRTTTAPGVAVTKGDVLGVLAKGSTVGDPGPTRAWIWIDP